MTPGKCYKTGNRPFCVMNPRKASVSVLRFFTGLGCYLITMLPCLPATAGVTLETGGYQIVLPDGWEVLNQPTTMFTQHQARNTNQGTAVSAGAFKLPLTLTQYAAISVAAFDEGPEPQYERISKLLGIPVAEVERAIQSQVGRLLLKDMKKSYVNHDFELLSMSRTTVAGVPAYEMRTKLTDRRSGLEAFTRRFTLNGASSNELVNISIAGKEALFQDQTLVDAIQKVDGGSAPILTGPIAPQVAESGAASGKLVDRDTFSVSLPSRWTEDTNDDMYEPDSMVFFDGPESCFFYVMVGKKSAGASVDAMLNSEWKAFSSKFTEPVSAAFANWASYHGQGFEIEGKILGITKTRVRVFGFEKGDNICVVIEYGVLSDLKKYAADFDRIRQSFKVK